MRLLIALILFASTASAQYRGLDVLGLAKQDVKMIMSEYQPGTALGVADCIFGDVFPSLEYALSTGKLSAVRIHLLPATRWGFSYCSKPTDFGALTAGAKKVEALAKKYPAVRFYISPVLEHDEKSNSLVNAWLGIIRNHSPSSVPVLSAYSGIGSYPGFLTEKHGNTAIAEVRSNDGASLFDADTGKFRVSGSTMVLGWINRFNGRVTGEKEKPAPPKERKPKASRDDIKQALRVLGPVYPKPKAPAACKTSRELKGSELWKTNAEDYNTADPRENRPLLIGTLRSSKADILSPSGQKIGCVKYYGRYANTKLNRYYVGSCSGDSAVSLMDKAKHEWVFIRDGSNCLMVNAIRRGPYYRD